MTALQRRAEEGGSWHVRVSLAGTGRWLQSMGLITDPVDLNSVYSNAYLNP